MNKKLWGLALSAWISLGSAAMAETGVTPTEIKVGMVNAQTGNASGLGKGMRQGAEAVFNEINAKGGINGRKIKLVVGDDAYDPNKTVDATVKMLEDENVFSLFGFVGTPTGNAALPIVKDAHVPLVGLFSGAMSFRQPLTHEVVNLRASYDDEAEALVDRYVKENGAKRFAVFRQDDGFGQAVLSGTQKALQKRGMDVVAVGSFERGTVAVQAGLAKVLEAKPDVVIMVGPYTPVAAFIKAARAAGLTAQLATVSFVGTDNLVKALGPEGEGTMISQVVPFPEATSLPLTKECSDLIAKYFPGEKLGFVNYEGAVTAKLFAMALAKAGPDLTRDGMIAAMEGIQNVDLGGLSVSLSAKNHQASDRVFLTQIKGGKITAIAK